MALVRRVEATRKEQNGIEASLAQMNILAALLLQRRILPPAAVERIANQIFQKHRARFACVRNK